jgi:hypothetical protein
MRGVKGHNTKMKLPCREARPMAEELPKIFRGIPDEFFPPEPMAEGVQLRKPLTEKMDQHNLFI